MKTYEFNIEGMTCEQCAATIAKALDIEGVTDKDVSYPEAKAIVAFDEASLNTTNIVAAIDSTGHYKVTTYHEAKQEEAPRHLIIVGGGSAAFAATIEAHGLGVKVTMINAGLPIGGTCVNVGCVPSKNLIRAAETVYKANHNPFAGITSRATVDDFQKLIDAKRELVRDLRTQKYISIVEDMQNFELVEGRARLLSGTSVQVGDRVIEGTHILLCSGASPSIPDIAGLHDVGYLTNKTAFELDALPESIIVLGGSYIALEIAQMFSRLGTKVTVLQRSERILSTQEADVTDELAKHLVEEGLEIVTNNQIQKVSEANGIVTVISSVDGTLRDFSAQKLIVATGRKANTADMNLERIGIALEKSGAVRVNDHLRTSLPTVYAAGDVLGTHMFVYTAAYEGKLAVRNMFGPLQKKREYSVLPWVIFTDPQIAGVGLDETEAKARELNADTATLPLHYVPRAIAANDTRGFIKLIRNADTDTLIGARIVAPEGSELLMEVSLAIKFNITVSDLKEMLHPYLTLGEGIKLAAITFSKSVEALSCCAT